MALRPTALAFAGAAATLCAVALSAQSPPAAPGPSAASGNDLPEGPARETLRRVCSGCHAADVVAKQRHTEKDWHDLVEMMAGNGAPGTDAEFAEITAYLAKNFPATD